MNLVLRAADDGERDARAGFHIHQESRFRSEKSAADAKPEKTSLSAGGFLRVPYGYRSCLRLCYWRAMNRMRAGDFFRFILSLW